ncbi:MAG: hypothetical protein U0Q55_00100 [Vicinamibacterales bacterium]
MARSVRELIQSPPYAMEHRYAGTVPWLGAVTHSFGGDQTGLYVVSFAKDIDSHDGARPDCPLHPERVRHWLEVRPELRLDGARPNAAQLSGFLAHWWIPDEHVLYVGRTEASLRGRVHAYYGTALGAKKPHAGGCFLKTLDCLDRLYVHLFVGEGHSSYEHMALLNFRHGLSDETRAKLPDAIEQLPFANLRWAEGPAKSRALTGLYGDL